MGSWTRQILAELERGGPAVNLSETRARKAARSELDLLDTLEPALDFIDFGSRLVSLSELAKVSGVGQKLLRNLARSGRLRPVRVPGARRLRYSSRQLAQIIREHNGLSR